MNIVQTTITYPPALGGLDRYVKETSEGLVKRGHHVVVVTTNLEQPISKRTIAIPAGYRDLAEVHRFSTVRIPRTGFPFSLRMKPAILRASPEVIHAHCVLHSTALAGWRAARRIRCRFVINTIYSPRSGWFWRLYRPSVVRMMQDADAVIAISDFERQLLAEAGLNRNKVDVLPPGVDLTAFITQKPSILANYGFDRNRVVVSLGRLAFGKRVDRLIHAMPALIRKHPDVRLLIIGPDYGDAERLRWIVRSLQLDSFVTFAGALHESDAASALQHSVAFAMTTDFELFGITLIEAMAAGTAVIAPNVASVPNVVRDTETGLLYEYRSSDDLFRKLDRVLTDDALRQRLVLEGRREAETRFDFQKHLDALERIYTGRS